MIYFIMPFKFVYKIVCVLCITVVYTARTYDHVRGKRSPLNTKTANNYSTSNIDLSNDRGGAGYWVPTDSQDSTQLSEQWSSSSNRELTTPPEPAVYLVAPENRGPPGASEYWGSPGHKGLPEPPGYWRPHNNRGPPRPPPGPPPPPPWHLHDDHAPPGPPGFWGRSYNRNAPGPPPRWHRPNRHGPPGPPRFWGPPYNRNYHGPPPHWYPPYHRGYPRPGPPGRWGPGFRRGSPNYRGPPFHRRPPGAGSPPVHRDSTSHWGLPSSDNQDSPKHPLTEQAPENWSSTDSKGHSENLSTKRDNTPNNWNLPENKNSQSDSNLPNIKENMDAEITIEFRNTPFEYDYASENRPNTNMAFRMNTASEIQGPRIHMNLTNSNYYEDAGTSGMVVYGPYLFQAVPVTPEV